MMRNVKLIQYQEQTLFKDPSLNAQFRSKKIAVNPPGGAQRLRCK